MNFARGSKRKALKIYKFLEAKGVNPKYLKIDRFGVKLFVMLPDKHIIRHRIYLVDISGRVTLKSNSTFQGLSKYSLYRNKLNNGFVLND